MDAFIKLALRWVWQNTRSWKTTAIGAAQVLTGLALLAGFIGGDVPSPDADTVAGLREMVAWLLLATGTGSWLSRDATVSSNMTKIR